MIIAIDGTSGSGKSTIASRIAQIAGFELLNTGLIYRKITKECIRAGIEPFNDDEIGKIIQSISTDTINNEDLHSEEISTNVASYAKNEKTRELVRLMQRDHAKGKNIIVEGRDIGSVVFPDADIKFFIDADLEERAKRRMKQLGIDGEKELSDIMKSLGERDAQDEKRDNSPLVKADDAIAVDTTGKTIDEAVERVLAFIPKISGKT